MIQPLLLLCLLVNCALAQDPQSMVLPKDPLAAIAAMPVTDPVEGGRVVKVIDGGSKTPIANATVVALTKTHSESFQKRGTELRDAMFAQKIHRKHMRVLMAATMGTRYQTDSNGAACIPLGKDTFAVVISGAKIGQWYAGQEGPVQLFAPRFVSVQVLNSRGKPARNVEIGLGRDDRHFHPAIREKTDAKGICKLEITDQIGSNDLRVEAIVACDQRIAAEFQADAIPDAPLQLKLPPCGQVRFILYGEDERPSNALTRALLNWQLSPEAAKRSQNASRMTTMWPSRLDPDGAMFMYVGLNLDIHVSAFIEGVPQALMFEAKGPTREHELIIVEGRVHTGPPVITVRVLDQRGQPVANEEVGTVLYSDRRYSHQHSKTDADGKLVLLVKKDTPDSLYVVRRSKAEGTDYRGAGHITLDNLKPGKQELPDLQLEDEPVIASGTVVDADGKPVAGVWLRGKTTNTSGGSGGGSYQTEWYCFEHRVQTDEQGRFQIREVAPTDHVMHFSLDSDEWALLDDPPKLREGDTDEIIRVGVAAELQGQLLGDLDGTRLDTLVTNRETKKMTSHSLRDGKFQIGKLPAGAYDITFGRNADFKIENVKAAKQGEAQDPRLRTDEWQQHFQVLKTTVTDADDKPLENITVYYYEKIKNSKRGYGSRTDKQGVARRLMPIKNASIEVRQLGYEAQTFTENLQDLKVSLQPIAAIDVQILGMPALPDEVIASLAIGNNSRFKISSRVKSLQNGRAKMQPTTLGKCELQITLRVNYSRRIPRAAQQALQRALDLKPITFDLVGTRKATDPKVFTLDQNTIDDINACLADAREALKLKDK